MPGRVMDSRGVAFLLRASISDTEIGVFVPGRGGIVSGNGGTGGILSFISTGEGSAAFSVTDDGVGTLGGCKLVEFAGGVEAPLAFIISKLLI